MFVKVGGKEFKNGNNRFAMVYTDKSDASGCIENVPFYGKIICLMTIDRIISRYSPRTEGSGVYGYYFLENIDIWL